MPFEITYSMEPCSIVARFYGVVTDDDLVQSCADRVQSAGLIQKVVFILDDFSEVTESQITAECVKDCAMFATDISVINKNIKYFSVMPTDHLYYLAKLWKHFSCDTGWDEYVVKTREEANRLIAKLMH